MQLMGGIGSIMEDLGILGDWYEDHGENGELVRNLLFLSICGYSYTLGYSFGFGAGTGYSSYIGELYGNGIGLGYNYYLDMPNNLGFHYSYSDESGHGGGIIYGYTGFAGNW